MQTQIRRWWMRRFGKWTGVFLLLLLLLGGLGSLRWAHIRWYHPRLGVIEFAGGGIAAIFGNDKAHGGFEFDLGKTDRDYVNAQWRLRSWFLYFSQSTHGISVMVPLWIPLVALSILTAWLWYLDRRRPAPGTCKCGYDLTGNASGRCPECGLAI